MRGRSATIDAGLTKVAISPLRRGPVWAVTNQISRSSQAINVEVAVTSFATPCGMGLLKCKRLEGILPQQQHLGHQPRSESHRKARPRSPQPAQSIEDEEHRR